MRKNYMPYPLEWLKGFLPLSTRRGEEMFEALQAKVEKIVSAADAMELVLEEVRGKVTELLASSHLTDEDRAKLEALETALDVEAEDITAKTLANTPAAPTS